MFPISSKNKLTFEPELRLESLALFERDNFWRGLLIYGFQFSIVKRLFSFDTLFKKARLFKATPRGLF